ncbi:MAG: 1-acyl-sn-glycerol-3-phosphate acyltransferase [Prevotellaceae bacterium]|jgi:1-acyl-sn-glycerol-3-phosphate acyltransferase|nr:1-acyl-sn-glycerol-3-phosphate acyltransferase [Prevotellaceae bacterium]
MITFKNIDRFSIRYFLLYLYVRFAFRHIYLKQYRAVGLENIPKSGEPLVIVCNHQSGLNDALAILFMFRDYRQPVFVARGDMFRRTFIARLLRFVKIMPAFRVMDGDNPLLNYNLFDDFADVLGNGHSLMMFPEAGHESTYTLGRFRKGFARVAFHAEKKSGYTLGLKILPVANHYSGYFNFREKLAMVVGKPVELSEFLPLYRENPEKAILALTKSMHDKVGDLMLNIKDREQYHLYNFIRAIYERRYAQRMGWKASYFPNMLRASKAIITRLEGLHLSSLKQQVRLFEKAQLLKEGLEKLRLRSWLFERRQDWRRLVLGTVSMVCLFPLFFGGYLFNIIPFSAPRLVTGKLKDAMLRPTVAFGASVLITFPVFYLLLAFAGGFITGSVTATLLFLISLPAGLIFFDAYRKHFVKLRGRWRFLLLRRQKNKLFEQTQDLFVQVTAEMDVIMGL